MVMEGDEEGGIRSFVQIWKCEEREEMLGAKVLRSRDT